MFYNGLVRNGILLYDNGGHVPCDCARPDPLRALEGAVAGFEKYFPDAVNLLYSVTTRLLPAENYRQSARRLHEACDKFYRTVWTVHTNHSPGTLPLDELGGLVKRYSREFAEIFPCHDDFEAESYELLCRAPKERGAAYSATRANGWATWLPRNRGAPGSHAKNLRRTNRVLHRSWPRLPSARKVFPGKRISPEDKSAFRYGLPKGFVYLNSKTFPNVKKYALTLLFAFALAAMHGQDRGLPERLERSLDSMILDAMQIKAFPGAQLVIGDREGVLYARNYGYHDYSRKREVTDRDLYE